MSLEPGTTLGPYSVTAKIGEGGMGEVYRARDTTLDRDVAIKVLPDAFASDPERLARFEREAKVLASLNHPQHRRDLRAGKIRRHTGVGAGACRRPDAGGSDQTRADPAGRGTTYRQADRGGIGSGT